MNRRTSAWAAAHAPAGTRWGKKALSLLLSLALCLGLLPGMAQAADTGSTAPKAIQLGTGGLQNPKMETYTSPSKPSYYVPQSYVYFGVDAQKTIKWRVLDADKANDGSTNGIFLLSEDTLLGATIFNQTDSGNSYQGSTAQQWCGKKVSGGDFSDIERDAMLGVAKTDTAPTAKLFGHENGWGESSLTAEDKLFFLSVQELYDHVGESYGNWMKVNSTRNWWLRTPDATDDQKVGYVSDSGDVNSEDVTATGIEGRPAFNLKKDAVLMISVRSYKSIEVGQLTAVGDADNVKYGTETAREWKLTLKDNSRKDFTANATAVSGDTLTFSYENAKTGENEYLSALIKGSDSTVKFYGRILELDADSKAGGTADIPLPEGFDRATDQLFVYSEQCNSDAQTDYASKLVELTLPEYAISADFTELDFGSVPTGFTAVPAAKTVTITNTGTKQITVNLPQSNDYDITAVSGFTGDNATLAAGVAASFAVQPKTDCERYADTLTVTTDRPDVQCEIRLSFTRSDAQPTEYAQVTLVNNYAYGCQLLFCNENTATTNEPRALIQPITYDFALYKLPENADAAKNTKNVVSSGKSVSILIPAGIYDYYAAAPTLDRNADSDNVWACGINDASFEAGKHYTITVSEESRVTQTEQMILSIYTVTVEDDGNGSGTATPATAATGAEITLSATANSGYHFKEWQVVSGDVTITDNKFIMPASNVTVKAIFEADTPISTEYTVTFEGNSGTPSVTSMTTVGKKLASLPTATRNGYTLDGWYTAANGGIQITTAYEFSADTTVYAHWTYTGGSSSGGGGSSSSSTTKTETTTNPDGSTTKTETKSDGTVIETITGKDGSSTKTETKPDGSSKTEVKDASGSTGTVNTDKNGNTTANAAISSKAVSDAEKSGEPVKVPTKVKAGTDIADAPTVKIDLPSNAGETKVEIPVENMTPGTVAVLVKADGTEEIIKTSIPTEAGIQFTVGGDVTVKIADNAKDFTDTKGHWAEASIDFVSARGLVNGTSESTFSPNAPTTRAQLWTILARQAGADLTSGANWYEKAQDWAKTSGVSDGSNPNGTITRAQMVTMLWRAEGSPSAKTAGSFTDVAADSYYAQAVAWAVENGITTGVGSGKFDPNGTCTRAQITTFLYRLYLSR